MSFRKEIEEKIAMPLGERGSNRKVTHAIFEQKGLDSLNPTTISRIKSEMTSGEKTHTRLEIASLLELDNASLKNSLYQNISQVGIEKRIFNSSPNRANILKTDHYTDEIALTLEQRDQVVRQAIRAMRADMVLTQTIAPNEALTDAFCSLAEGYVAVNLAIPPSLRSPQITHIDNEWDHRTMKSFYKNIYALAGGRSIGTWVPYEMEVLKLFYIQQDVSGNHLTSFDQSLLTSYLKGISSNGVITDIRNSVGIKIDEKTIELHRNVLLYGALTDLPKE